MKSITRAPEYSDADQIAELVNPYRLGTAISPYSVDTIYSSSPEPLESDYIKQHIAMAKEYEFPYFVHEVDGQIVGILTGVPFMIKLPQDILDGPVDRMIEVTIAVKANTFNTGAGASMYKSLMKYAKQNDIHSIWGGIYGINRSVTINANILGFKHVTTLKDFRQRNSKSYDLHLFRKVVK